MGEEKQAEEKIRQSEIINNLGEHKPKFEGISFRKTWQVNVIDNKLVPTYYNGEEIRPINTKKLLELRKENPNIKIDGIEFYQSETAIVRFIFNFLGGFLC